MRLIFRLYTHDRFGGRVVARILNDRGHRTTTGGTFSSYQVVRILANPSISGNCPSERSPWPTATLRRGHRDLRGSAAHLPQRGEGHCHRLANSSDYQLTGLMRCPQCDKAVIGTRAHGKKKVYRYYTCFTRSRYDSTKCDGHRLNADATEAAEPSTPNLSSPTPPPSPRSPSTSPRSSTPALIRPVRP